MFKDEGPLRVQMDGFVKATAAECPFQHHGTHTPKLPSPHSNHTRERDREGTSSRPGCTLSAAPPFSVCLFPSSMKRSGESPRSPTKTTRYWRGSLKHTACKR